MKNLKNLLQMAIILFILLGSSIVYEFDSNKIKELQKQNVLLKQKIITKSNEVAKLENDIKVKSETITKLNQEVETLKSYGSVPISEQERNLLAKLVMAEAENQPLDGKIAIVSVVLNRLEDSRFPKTIREIVYAKKQFSPISDGRINNNPTQECFYAVDIATVKRNENRLNGAVYFYNQKEVGRSRWFDSLKTVAIIGNHVFKL